MSTPEGPILLPTATPAETRRTVAELLRPRRRLAATTLAVMVAATACELAGPAVLGRMVDVVADGRPAADLGGPAAALVVLALAGALLTGLGLALVARVGEGSVADLRERVMDRALGLDLQTVERAGRGDLVSRLSDDVRLVAESVTTVVPTLATTTATIGLALAGLAALDWRFALAALCAAPIQAHTLRWYLGRARPLYAESRRADGARAQALLETLGGADTVRTLLLGDRHLATVRDRSRAGVEASLRAVRLSTRFYGRLNVAEVVGMTAVLGTGFVLVRDGGASVGEATAAALYFHRLFNPVNALLGNIDTAQSAAAGLARLAGVLGLPAAAASGATASGATASGASRNGGVEPGAIVVDGVGFAYRPGQPVLHDVTLTVRPGEHVAVVGASGAGKSTLAKLVAGVHEPATGAIAVGRATGAIAVGRATGAIAVGRATGAIAGGRAGPHAPAPQARPPAPAPDERPPATLVTQETHTFAGPLADDLRLADPGASDADLRHALAEVGALAWAEALPDGLATVVGEGGHRLTPTQAQQLALARLALADAPVVVLDEATADAGSAGARTLEAAARRALAGRTALVVAHRLTQAAAADRVIVLDRGRVVEDGTHDDLVAAGGAYATLWRAWSGRGTNGADGDGRAATSDGVRTAPAPTPGRPATPDGRAPTG